MMPAKYTLEEAAMIVWSASKSGRRNAEQGLRGSAVAYMDALKGVMAHEKPESLVTVARSAVESINRLLTAEVAS